MVNEVGIKANLEKIKIIMEIRSPSSTKDVQQLARKVATLNRFISRSADKNLPFFETLQAMKRFEWTPTCEQAFTNLKAYLSSPPLLSKPIEGEPLYLYLAVSENTVSSVLMREEAKIHKPVYYVNKMLQGAEKRYLETEKLVLTLVVLQRKLQPYFQAHVIIVLTNQPLRQKLSKPEVSGRMIKWSVELEELGIQFQSK